MPWYITSYITRYFTNYVTRYMGVLTKLYTLEEAVDEEGNKVIVTRVVRVITAPLIPERKTVLVNTRELGELLREITTVKKPLSRKNLEQQLRMSLT